MASAANTAEMAVAADPSTGYGQSGTITSEVAGPAAFETLSSLFEQGYLYVFVYLGLFSNLRYAFDR